MTQTFQCSYCGSDFNNSSESQRYTFRKTGRIYCTKECGRSAMAEDKKRRAKRAEPIPGICSWCGGSFLAVSAHDRSKVRNGGRAYCSTICSKAYQSRRSSETMAATNRKYASDRMKKRNPMRLEENRIKVSETMKARGHMPTVQGGNGKKIPEAERVLIETFAPIGFTGQCVVPTGMPRDSGYPTCYKIDCGNPLLKVGIEADGNSHNSLARRTMDEKKDAFLTERGWRIYRFKNDEIISDPDRVFTTVIEAIFK